MSTEQILQERGQTHGPFIDHATCTQALKDVVHGFANWQRMPPDQKESVEMILHKIGRVMAGDPNHQDHWDDIAGYATLVSKRLVGAAR